MNDRIFKIRVIFFIMIIINGALIAAARHIFQDWSIHEVQKELFKISALAWLVTFFFIDKRDDDWQNIELG